MEILKSISIKYPEYSVITPQTVLEFTVRSLNVSEEERLKGSLLTPNQFARHLNQIIWESIVKKPEEIKTYDDFINKTSIKDRDALLFGIYHATYKDVTNYDINCNQCNKSYSVSFNIKDAFAMDSYVDVGKGPLLDQEFECKLEVAENITVIVKQPTIGKEEATMKDMLFQNKENIDMGVELLIIDRITIEDPDMTGRTETYTEPMNLLKIYKQLPSKDRKLINKKYMDELGQYKVSMNMQTVCSSCGKESTSDIDLVSQFFRSLYQ